MTISEDAIAFGLTGAFGSGCSTLAAALENSLSFQRVKLSDLILEVWREENTPEGALSLDMPQRGVLQDIGDRDRRSHGRGYWAQKAVQKVDDLPLTVELVVFDGIRNTGEVEWFRKRFKRFYLIAVDAHPNKRWERLQNTPAWENRSRADFDSVSARDIEAPEDWGQRVQQCVDLADCLITNDVDEVPPKAQEALLAAAADFLKLCQQPHRRPSDEELFMHLAYSTAWGSACLKRNVGAIIVRPNPKPRSVGLGQEIKQRASVVSTGFNENPEWMQPCYLEYKACYRDIWRFETWNKRGYRNCPYCGANISAIKWPYNCPNTACPGPGGSLLGAFFPERAMTKCTAVHAEVRAILNARGTNLDGCVMYVTTLPCFLCAEQVLQSGITGVVYVEPYPEERSEQLLLKHGVVLTKFHGVKSLAFARFFEPWRAQAEQAAAEGILLWSSNPTDR